MKKQTGDEGWRREALEEVVVRGGCREKESAGRRRRHGERQWAGSGLGKGDSGCQWAGLLLAVGARAATVWGGPKGAEQAAGQALAALVADARCQMPGGGWRWSVVGRRDTGTVGRKPRPVLADATGESRPRGPGFGVLATTESGARSSAFF